MNQFPQATVLQFMGDYVYGSSMGTQSLNTATTWVAFSWVEVEGKTVDKIQIFETARAGTVNASDVTLTVYGDNAGVPDSGGSAVISATACSTAPAANTVLEFDVSNTALTAGTRYHAVIKNNAGTPASNNITLLTAGVTGGTFNNFGGAGSLATAWGWGVQRTTDGSSWIALAHAVTCMRIEYSDGSYQGYLYGASGSGVNLDVYASREVGIYFTVPANMVIPVAGLVFKVQKGGTPTGTLQYRLYTGASPTLQRTTLSGIGVGNVSTSTSQIPLYFSSIYTLQGGDIVRCVVSETTQSDSSSDYYRTRGFTIPSGAAYRELAPFGLRQTLSTDGGASFAETDTVQPECALLFDAGFTYPSPGGGGGAAQLVNTTGLVA